MGEFANITNGREAWNPKAYVPRHRHDQAYAAIVLAGCYEECGSLGRLRVTPGDVVFHGRFEAHLDRFGIKGAQIANLVLPESEIGLHCAVGRTQDADAIIRAAEADLSGAWLQLREQVTAVASPPTDWTDSLAADLAEDPELHLGDWASRQGLAPETISRGFRNVFGVTPASFRAEARAHKAFARLMAGSEPLAAVAAEAGFADQAHMSRATKALTGKTPGFWRAMSNRFKTGAAGSR